LTARTRAQPAPRGPYTGTIVAAGKDGPERAAARHTAAPKVMHVITGLHTGGAERMLCELVLAQRDRACPPTVVSLLSGGRIFERLTEANVPVVDFGMRRGRPGLSVVWRLAAYIRRARPDVIQSWMYHADLAATLALWLSGRRRCTRLFWGVRCSNMDLRRYGRGLAMVIDACSWLSGAPDAIVANSDEGRAFHERLGYRPRRFVVIENGTNTDVFRPDAAARRRVRAALGIAEDRPLLALVARVDPMKDHAGFLAALDRLQGVAALAIGRGTERLPDRPGLHRLGERGDVPDLLAAADLVVSSSAFGEGFSNALVEGMAAGLPAVATDVGDARRIVGDTGIVVPPGDPEALAAAIARLLGEAPQARARRRRQARRRIVDNFSLERAVAAFDALYRGTA